MNGAYTPSFLHNFADYEAAGLTKVLDNEIPESAYTAEIAPGIPKLTRFIVGEYEDAYVDGARFAASVAAVGARFQIEMFATPQEAVDWIRANTNLVETEPGTFLIHEAYSDPIIGDIPAKYLNIA